MDKHKFCCPKTMLGRTFNYLLIAAFAIAPLSGCAYMTKNGRQQMAYQRYVKKNSGRKMKQQKKFKSPKMPLTPGPSDNQITTEVGGSPQSVHSNEAPLPVTQDPPPDGN